MEMTNLTRNIQSAIPDKAILDAPTLKTGDEYWYISTNNLESCVIGYGKLINQINRIKSLITTKSAYGSQFEKIFVFENPFEKTYVYSASVEHIGLLASLFLRSFKYKRMEWILLDFSIKTLSDNTKELYVGGKLVASGTQEEIFSIMRLMTQCD